jgi:chorismate mutase-like protein
MNIFVADPHWGWWIVWYFYLGGIAAGAYFLAALVEFVGDEQDRRVGRVGYLLAAPLVAVCGLLLIVDLDQPSRFWHMLFDAESFRPHLKYWSPMSIGAWALLLFGAVSTVSFVGALSEAGWCGLGRWCSVARRLHNGWFGRTFDVIGSVCGFFIAAYTGALLTATNQPVWSDSTWLAAMFLASSATSGVAAIRLVGQWTLRPGEATLARLDRVEAWALGLEICTIVLFLSRQRSAAVPIFELPPIWWLLIGTVGLGVFVPLLLRLQPALGRRGTPMFAATLVLAGGFVLRYAVLAVGPAVLERPRVVTIESRSPIPSDPRAESAVDELWSVARDRLGLMESVARVKWQKELPIEDPDRESELLDAARAWAGERGVPPDAAELFLRSQIDAAKRVQRAWFVEWNEKPPVDDQTPSLVQDLRLRLDAITDRLLDAFARSRSALKDGRHRKMIGEHMDDALGGIRLEPDERRELLESVVRAATIVAPE